jgi:hypothetical protein
MKFAVPETIQHIKGKAKRVEDKRTRQEGIIDTPVLFVYIP